jgi:hypothetical protein
MGETAPYALSILALVHRLFGWDPSRTRQMPSPQAVLTVQVGGHAPAGCRVPARCVFEGTAGIGGASLDAYRDAQAGLAAHPRLTRKRSSSRRVRSPPVDEALLQPAELLCVERVSAVGRRLSR